MVNAQTSKARNKFTHHAPLASLLRRPHILPCRGHAIVNIFCPAGDHGHTSIACTGCIINGRRKKSTALYYTTTGALPRQAWVYDYSTRTAQISDIHFGTYLQHTYRMNTCLHQNLWVSHTNSFKLASHNVMAYSKYMAGTHVTCMGGMPLLLGGMQPTPAVVLFDFSSSPFSLRVLQVLFFLSMSTT